jgi:hypothetical protein
MTREAALLLFNLVHVTVTGGIFSTLFFSSESLTARVPWPSNFLGAQFYDT